MFRATKKRPRTTNIRKTQENNDDEEEEAFSVGTASILMASSKKKKTTKRKHARRNNDDSKANKSRRTEVRGGGKELRVTHERGRKVDGTAAAARSEQSLGMQQQRAFPSHGYSKEALSQLKSEQEYKPAEEAEEVNSGPTELEKDGEIKSSKEIINVLPSYIPLPRSSDGATEAEDKEPSKQEEPAILTGEEAFLFEKEKKQQSNGSNHEANENADELMGTVVEETNLFSNDKAEESSAWEAQITRRAGLSNNNNNSSRVEPPPHQLSSSSSTTRALNGKTIFSYAENDASGGAAAATTTNNNPCLQLRNKFASTLVQLNEQHHDVERAIQRRETEARQTRDELHRQETDLAQSGEALEFYQGLRVKIVAWVGALRELSTKILPIQDALNELESQVAANKRWQDWENDLISILHNHGLLDQVVGRQPPSSILDNMSTVDEFGRNDDTKYVRQRQKRVSHRRKIQQQRQKGPVGDESDAFLSDGEQENFRERHVALQTALALALDELDEHYKTLNNLVDVFHEWQQAYGQDYDQCFATLSLGDLASIMVQVQLSALNDPWDESKVDIEANWATVVHEASRMSVLDQAGVERIFEKSIVPALSDTLNRLGYNLASSRQTRSLCTFYRNALKIIPSESTVVLKLRDILVSYVQQQLQDLAIPTVRKEAMAQSLDSEEIKEAVQGATVGQVRRIKKILLNLLTHWASILGGSDDFCVLILDFVSSKFLFLLSSISTFSQLYFQSAADSFNTVWEALQLTGWLDRPEWLVQGATLRAAAAAYQA